MKKKLLSGSLSVIATVMLCLAPASATASTGKDCYQTVEQQEVQVINTYDENGQLVKQERKVVTKKSVEKVDCP